MMSDFTEGHMQNCTSKKIVYVLLEDYRWIACGLKTLNWLKQAISLHCIDLENKLCELCMVLR